MKNKTQEKTRLRQQKRRAELNKLAKQAGFSSWSAYETACIKKGKV